MSNNMTTKDTESQSSINSFFYRFWWLFYLLIFILVGIIFFVGCQPKRSIDLNSIHNKLSTLEDQIECGLRKKNQIPVVEAPNEDSIVEVPENAIPCNSGPTYSGGQGVTENQHVLGSNPGVVTVSYDMENQPDKIDVIYNGKIVASTRTQVSGQGNLRWNYVPVKGGAIHCDVRVSAPEEGTVWRYNLGCPE